MKHYLTLSAMITCAIAYAEPANIHWAEEELLAYHNSGAYLSEFAAVDQQAQDYLTYAVTHNQDHKKLAIVLDIDETSLSNWPQLQCAFTDKFSNPLKFYNNFDDIALTPTLSLYQYAIAHDVSVFFITGRYISDTKDTEKNLKQAGYKQWKALILRNKEEKNLPAQTYKIAHRKSISESGYDIVLNIGDQSSDLAGGYADASYKLPNPFYYIP